MNASLPDRASALRLIERNIATHGWHLYAVLGGPIPRFSYTIGLLEKTGFELVFAGGYFYSFDDIPRIVNGCGDALLRGAALEFESESVPGTFTFTLGNVRAEWSKALLLGANDWYGHTVHARQIIPEAPYLTRDVPDMSLPASHEKNAVWVSLFCENQNDMPEDTKVLTDLGFLRGAPATHVIKYEEGQWDCYSQDPRDMDDDAFRTVPLGVVLALEPSLRRLCEGMADKSALARDAAGHWRAWDGVDFE